MNELLNDIIDQDRVPTFAEAEALLARYPACVLPAVAALKSPDLTAEEQSILREKIALAIGDRSAIMRILDDDGTRFDGFYPDPRHSAPSTVATIDDFLGKFAAPVPPMALGDDFGRSELPYNFEKNEQIDEIDEEAPAEISEEDNTPAEPEISEENAANMIKNRDYQGALQIIQTLSLNNPEKSVYFADQIRFLRKLIINDNNIK